MFITKYRGRCIFDTNYSLKRFIATNYNQSFLIPYPKLFKESVILPIVYQYIDFLNKNCIDYKYKSWIINRKAKLWCGKYYTIGIVIELKPNDCDDRFKFHPVIVNVVIKEVLNKYKNRKMNINKIEHQLFTVKKMILELTKLKQYPKKDTLITIRANKITANYSPNFSILLSDGDKVFEYFIG
jgi:hypothetical protein